MKERDLFFSWTFSPFLTIIKNVMVMTFLFGFVSGFSEINAQYLIVKHKDGSETSHVLKGMAKLTFSDGKMGIYTNQVFSRFYLLSNIRFLKFSEGTSVEFNSNPSETNTILLYPNPTSNVLTLRTKSESIKIRKIEIINLEGMVLIDKAMENYTNSIQVDIDISTLPTGIYYCRVHIGNSFEIEKIIKK